MKTYISHVENHFLEIDEDILNRYLTLLHKESEAYASHIEINLIQSEGEMREVCYKTYDVPGAGLVTIKMANQLDNVGLTSWEAGFYLAEFLIEYPGSIFSL